MKDTMDKNNKRPNMPEDDWDEKPVKQVTINEHTPWIAMILGGIAIVIGFFVPILGIPTAVVSLLLALKARESQKKSLCNVAYVLAVLGLCIGIAMQALLILTY